MDVLEAIRQRRATRQFASRPVPQEMLRQLIEAGTWAPSAMNGQPWRFVVITNSALIDRISDQSRQWILDNRSAFPEMEKLAAMLREPEFHIFYHAPALIIIAAPLGVRWGMEGCVLAAENVMLAATALGLGTCWIGMAEGWLNSGAGRAVLHLPDATHVVAPIAVGYQKETPAPVPRQKPEVTWLDGLGGPVFEHEETRNISTRAGLYRNLIHP